MTTQPQTTTTQATLVDRRDLRQPGRPGRRAGDAAPPQVPALLYGELVRTLNEAEARYLRAIRNPRPELAASSVNLIRVELNAKAEGLAEAVAIVARSAGLEDDVVAIRRTAQRAAEESIERQLAGVDRARAGLELRG